MRQVYFTRHGSGVHVAVHAKAVNTNVMVFVVVVVDVVTVLFSSYNPSAIVHE